MTPEALSALGFLGPSAGIVIVVVYFLRAIEKRDTANQAYQDRRDQEWRSFFTALNSTNKDDVCRLAEMMERMVGTLDAHDLQAKAIAAMVSKIDENTRPLSPGVDRRKKVQ